MGPAAKATAERLAAAIREVASEHRHHRLADRAATGEFGDYADTHICPITECRRLCLQYGLPQIAARLEAGEFDASKEESDEWANSPEGQAIARSLSPELRAVLGMKTHDA